MDKRAKANRRNWEALITNWNDRQRSEKREKLQAHSEVLCNLSEQFFSDFIENVMNEEDELYVIEDPYSNLTKNDWVAMVEIANEMYDTNITLTGRHHGEVWLQVES